MLVLSRKAGESIYVDNNIKITVVRVGPNSVRLGIEAPRSKNIRRAEIADSNTPPEPEPVPVD